MAAYSVELSSRAERDLERLPASVQTRIVQALRRLGLDPHAAPNVKRLAGPGRLHRLRVGQYRVLYQLDEDRLLILVIRIGHRRDVYRGRARHP